MNPLKSPSVLLLAYGEMGPFAYRSLRKHFNITAVITPLSPSDLETSPELIVKNLAKKDQVKILQTNSNSEIESFIRKKKPQALVICSYNKILPASLLSLTRCINVHHGDLPRFRGRANLNWALINGNKHVGLTIHEAIPDLDAGNIYSQYRIFISKTETIKTLYGKIDSLVEKSLGLVVKRVLQGFKGKPQKGKGTYCCTRLPEDGYIDWKKSSAEIDRLIRGLTKPYPGAFTYFKGKKMIIWSAEILKHSRIYEGRIPGRIALIHKNNGVEVLTGNSSILIKKVTYNNKVDDASHFITSVKTTLGINFIELYEHMVKK